MGRLEQLVLGAAPRWLIDVLSRVKADARDRVAERQLKPMVAELFPAATGHELLVSNADAAVFRVDIGTDRSTILKVGTTEIACEQLATESAALDELQERTGLGEWRSLVATVEARGEHEGRGWFTQSRLSGQPTSKVELDPDVLVAAVIESLRPLHEATMVTAMADDPVLDELVTDPINTIKDWRPDLAEGLTMINGEMRQRLASLELSLSRQHGDFAPSNVLWDTSTGSVSGIVDWKLALDRLPPEIDYVHYALSMLMQRRRAEFGSTVVSLLNGSESSPAAAMIRAAADAGPNNFDLRTAVLLTWLQHISFSLYKAHDLRTNPIWLVNNIDTVVRAVQG